MLRRVSFGRDERLFLRENPSRRSARCTPERLVAAPERSISASASSATVASGISFTIVTRSSVFSLLELAVYLRSCRKLPGFVEVIPLLKTASQFSTARVQLALAHRLLHLGAKDVCLEPHADAGRKADISFVYGGRLHLLECYEPAPRRYGAFGELVHDGLTRILAAAKETDVPVIVRIDLKSDYRLMDVALRKRVEQEVTHAIRGLRRPALHAKKQLERFAIEVIGTEGVRPADVERLAWEMSDPRGARWVFAQTSVERDDLPRIPRNHGCDHWHGTARIEAWRNRSSSRGSAALKGPRYT